MDFIGDLNNLSEMEYGYTTKKDIKSIKQSLIQTFNLISKPAVEYHMLPNTPKLQVGNAQLSNPLSPMSFIFQKFR